MNEWINQQINHSFGGSHCDFRSAKVNVIIHFTQTGSQIRTSTRIPNNHSSAFTSTRVRATAPHGLDAVPSIRSCTGSVRHSHKTSTYTSVNVWMGVWMAYSCCNYTLSSSGMCSVVKMAGIINPSWSEPCFMIYTFFSSAIYFRFSIVHVYIEQWADPWGQTPYRAISSCGIIMVLSNGN